MRALNMFRRRIVYAPLAFVAIATAGFFAVRAIAWENAVDAFARASGLETRAIEIRGAPEGFAPTPEALGLALGQTWFAADLARAQARAEALPWTLRASVRFVYPSRVRARLVAARPRAWLRDSDGTLWAALENAARVRPDYVPADARLPLVVGPGALEAAPALADALPALGPLRARLRFARRVDGRRWDLVFEGGVVAHAPARGEALAFARLAALEAEGALFARDVERVDLRSARGVAVRLRPGARVLPPTDDEAAFIAPYGAQGRVFAPAYPSRRLFGFLRPHAGGGGLVRARSSWPRAPGRKFTLSRDFGAGGRAYSLVTDHQRPYPPRAVRGASGLSRPGASLPPPRARHRTTRPEAL